MHKPLRHEIQRRVAVADDGLQLAVKSRLYHVRQRVTIDSMRLIDRHIVQLLACIWDLRRMRAIRERLKLVAQIRDHIGRFNNDSVCFLSAEICKLLQHLVRCLKV